MTTLSLTLPREVAKIMPWIIAARATKDPRQIAWAKGEYEFAVERAQERERWERRLEELRLERERGLRESEERDRQRFEEWRKQKEYWHLLGIHFALEDGWEEIQPTQSSQKGRRRLLSECDDLVDKCRYGKWGGKHEFFRANENKRNCGRKPRAPWFK